MYFESLENTNIISSTCVMNLNLLQRYTTLQEKQIIIDLVLLLLLYCYVIPRLWGFNWCNKPWCFQHIMVMKGLGAYDGTDSVTKICSLILYFFHDFAFVSSSYIWQKYQHYTVSKSNFCVFQIVQSVFTKCSVFWLYYAWVISLKLHWILQACA